jgi:hypothetical protein
MMATTCEDHRKLETAPLKSRQQLILSPQGPVRAISLRPDGNRASEIAICTAKCLLSVVTRTAIKNMGALSALFWSTDSTARRCNVVRIAFPIFCPREKIGCFTLKAA